MSIAIESEYANKNPAQHVPSVTLINMNEAPLMRCIIEEVVSTDGMNLSLFSLNESLFNLFISFDDFTDNLSFASHMLIVA